MDEEEPFFEEQDIVNQEYYKGIKSMVNCPICLNIIEDPVQCDKCQHYFCSECIKQLNKCPFRCENNSYIPSLNCKNLLSELKIKCKCGKEFGYDFIKKHKEEECSQADFKKSYFRLKEKYEKLKKELNKKEEFDNIHNSYYVKSSLHKHPVELLRRFINNWYCDVCEESFDEKIPSYHCTLCDYDVCYDCLKDKVIKGTIIEEIKQFY